jgi:hypothetical protein
MELLIAGMKVRLNTSASGLAKRPDLERACFSAILGS